MTEPGEIETARKLFAGPCDFVWGATSAENLPPETLNEVAFVGRSNAGKSSAINALAQRKRMAFLRSVRVIYRTYVHLSLVHIRIYRS